MQRLASNDFYIILHQPSGSSHSCTAMRRRNLVWQWVFFALVALQMVVFVSFKQAGGRQAIPRKAWSPLGNAKFKDFGWTDRQSYSEWYERFSEDGWTSYWSTRPDYVERAEVWCTEFVNLYDEIRCVNATIERMKDQNGNHQDPTQLLDAVKQRLDALEEDFAAMKQAQKTMDKKIEFILHALGDLNC